MTHVTVRVGVQGVGLEEESVKGHMVDGSSYMILRGTEVRGDHRVPVAGPGVGEGQKHMTGGPGVEGCPACPVSGLRQCLVLAVTLAAVWLVPPLGEAGCPRTGALCSFLQLPVNLQ